MNRFLTFLALFGFLLAPTLGQEVKGPIERQNLIKALQIGGLSETVLIGFVKDQHLAFEMTISDEDAFRKAGAGESLITVLWENDAFKVQPGPPLSREQVVTLLQAGTPSRRMERIVRERKVKIVAETFIAASDEITKAGGSDDLINAIRKNLIEEKPKEDPKPVVVPVVKAPPAEDIGKKYDAWIVDAQTASKASDPKHALDILAEAENLDRKRPGAFLLEGLIRLYVFNEIGEAGFAYKTAIANGGEVELHVEHTHGRSKLTMKEQGCFGRMWISKTGVRFEADDKVHVFKFTRKEIMDVENDAAMKLAESGFHIKVDRGRSKAETLHFRSARTKNRADEDKLIVELLRQ